MPWQHCEHLEITDDRPCPTCGISKQEWTIKVQVTRVLRIGAGPACKLEVRDGAGQYLAGARYRIELPDGSTAEGELNAAGYAKATSKVAGDAFVSFPDLGAGVAVTAGGGVPASAPGMFRVKCGNTKHEFRQVVSWDGDANAQLDTLLRAAQHGSAFCEECAKAAQAA